MTDRLVLGVDIENHHEAAARLLERLRFTDARVDLFHAVEVPVMFGDAASMGQLLNDFLDEMQDAGRTLCATTAARLTDAGLTVGDTTVVVGSPAGEILRRADRVGARLIAVGSRGKGPQRAFFTGSVGRSLVIGAQQSVLVAKGAPAPDGPLRVVFATDHSAYANRCLAELLALAPQGIAHLTLVTCYPREMVRAIRPLLPEFVLDPAEWIEKSLAEQNDKAAAALAPLGCAIESRVASDTPASVLPAVMRETQSDLLILGAQGHGFVERMTLGSTSFHQVMAEPYPVLVLRVPPAAS